MEIVIVGFVFAGLLPRVPRMRLLERVIVVGGEHVPDRQEVVGLIPIGSIWREALNHGPSRVSCLGR